MNYQQDGGAKISRRNKSDIVHEGEELTSVPVNSVKNNKEIKEASTKRNVQLANVQTLQDRDRLNVVYYTIKNTSILPNDGTRST